MEMNKTVDIYTIYDYVTYNTDKMNCITILWDNNWKELDDLMKNEKPPFVTYQYIPYANYSWIDKIKEVSGWSQGFIIYIIGISINDGSYTMYFKKFDKKNIELCNGSYSDSYNTFINDEGYFVTANYHWENEPLQNSERIKCVYNEYIITNCDGYILK